VGNATFFAITNTEIFKILSTGETVSGDTTDLEMDNGHNPVGEGSNCSITFPNPLPPTPTTLPNHAVIDMPIYTQLNLLDPVNLFKVSSSNLYNPYSYDTPAFDGARNPSEMNWSFACQCHEGYLEIFPEVDHSVSMDLLSCGSGTSRAIDNQIFGINQSLSDSQLFPKSNSLNPLSPFTNGQQYLNLWNQAQSVSHTPCMANTPLVPDMSGNPEPDNVRGSGFGLPISSAMWRGSPSIEHGCCSADGYFSMQDHPPLQEYLPLQEYSSPQDLNVATSWTPSLPGNLGQSTLTEQPSASAQNAPMTVGHSSAATGRAFDWQDSSNDCDSVPLSLTVAMNANSSSSQQCLNQTRSPAPKGPENIYGRTTSSKRRCYFGNNNILSRDLVERSTKGTVRGCYGPDKRRKVASVRKAGACILCRVNKVEVDKMLDLWIFLLLIRRSVQSPEHARLVRRN
jgi:hypothetical protein